MLVTLNSFGLISVLSYDNMQMFNDGQTMQVVLTATEQPYEVLAVVSL